MNSDKTNATMRIGAAWRELTLTALAAFVIYVALRGISESFDNDDFPEPLAVKLEFLPVIFPVHMVSGGLTLLLVPLTLGLQGTKWHRFFGRVAAINILIAGITAIPVAMVMPVTNLSAIGFVAQGVVWLVLLGSGIWNIRVGRIASHRSCMLMMAAVTSGALFFRLYLGLWKVFGASDYFEAFYAFDAWIAWSLPLIGVAVWLKRLPPS